MDLAKTALAKRRSVKTIRMVSGSDNTDMVVTIPVISEQPGSFFGGIHVPGILRFLVANQALLLTFQTLPWLENNLQRQYARLERARVPMWVSLVR